MGIVTAAAAFVVAVAVAVAVVVTSASAASLHDSTLLASTLCCMPLSISLALIRQTVKKYQRNEKGQRQGQGQGQGQ